MRGGVRAGDGDGLRESCESTGKYGGALYMVCPPSDIECKPNLSFLRVKVPLTLNLTGSVYINMLLPAIPVSF